MNSSSPELWRNYVACFVLALFFSFVFGIQHLVPLAVLHCAVALLGFASVTNGFGSFTSGFASK